jgi:hypothetical protein
MGSPEVVAEAMLDVTSLVDVGVNWLTTDESVVEVSWIETILASVVLGPAATLLELDTVVWEASELVGVELVLDAISLVDMGVDWLTIVESVIEVSWVEVILVSIVLDPAELLLELDLEVWEVSELIVGVALTLETEPVEKTLTEDVPTSVEDVWDGETSWDWVWADDTKVEDEVLSIDDDCVDEVWKSDGVALSLGEDWDSETSTVDDDTSDVAETVEEKSDVEELSDSPVLKVISDEVGTAESELVVIETSEDDWVVTPGEVEADSGVLLISALDVKSLEVTVSLADWTGSDESLVAEADTLAGALLLGTAVPLAVLWLTLDTGR